MSDPAVERRFDTRADYLDAVEQVIGAAQREICIFDPDLKDLDVERPARVEALRAFLGAQRDRGLRLVLHDAAFLVAHCARLNVLLRQFSHVVQIRQTPESLRHLADCIILADGAHAAIRFHADHFRGKLLLHHPEETAGWSKRFEDLWLEALPAAPPTQLGL